MSYDFIKMTQEQAEEIAYQWHYQGAYSILNQYKENKIIREKKGSR